MLKYIDQHQPSVNCQAYLALAKIYSVLNEKAKALKYLQKVEDFMGFTILMVKDYKNCPMLDNIRHEPGFAAYLKVADTRHRNEHAKVEKLLRKEGILVSSIK
jgi:hypothetical protein